MPSHVTGSVYSSVFVVYVSLSALSRCPVCLLLDSPLCAGWARRPGTSWMCLDWGACTPSYWVRTTVSDWYQWRFLVLDFWMFLHFWMKRNESDETGLSASTNQTIDWNLFKNLCQLKPQKFKCRVILLLLRADILNLRLFEDQQTPWSYTEGSCLFLNWRFVSS